MSKHTSSVAFKLSLLSFILVLAACVITLLFSIYFYQRDLYILHENTALNIAESAVGGIDADEVEALIAEPKDDGYYIELKEQWIPSTPQSKRQEQGKPGKDSRSSRKRCGIWRRRVPKPLPGAVS